MKVSFYLIIIFCLSSTAGFSQVQPKPTEPIKASINQQMEARLAKDKLDTSSLISQGPIFQGKIFYENSFQSKIAILTDKQLSSMLGTTQEYLIKEGNYRSSSNGSMAGWLLYKGAENKLYHKMSDKEDVTWTYADENNDEVIGAKINKGVITILGYTCDELILQCKSGTQKYYYNTSLGVNVDLYSKHRYGNWFTFLTYSKSLPLKMIIETEQFVMESVVTKIIAEDIPASAFELPTGINAIKSGN